MATTRQKSAPKRAKACRITPTPSSFWSPPSARRRPARARRRRPSAWATRSAIWAKRRPSACASLRWARSSASRAARPAAVMPRLCPWRTLTCTSPATSTPSARPTTCSPPCWTTIFTRATPCASTPSASCGTAASTSTTASCAASWSAAGHAPTAFCARMSLTSPSPARSWRPSAWRAG